MTGMIDLTPTWGEIGNLIWRLAVTHEDRALAHARPEFARAMAAAQALTAIEDTLTDAQREIVARTLADEMRKQGVGQ